MNNLDVAKMNTKDFMAEYEKVKNIGSEKKPINSSSISLKEQLKKFKDSTFSEQDDKALYEDLLSV